MKAQIRHVEDQGDCYDAIAIWCPGCETAYGDGGTLHILPVTGSDEKRPVWGWNGDLVLVTLTPSILTRSSFYTGPDTPPREFVCHSFLTDGVWNFLGDCTHKFKDQQVPMVDLPDWVVE